MLFISTALLFYDYFLTLDREIRCVWRSKFSGVTVLFLLNRYVTLLYRVLMIVQLMSWGAFEEVTADRVRPFFSPISARFNVIDVFPDVSFTTWGHCR